MLVSPSLFPSRISLGMADSQTSPHSSIRLRKHQPRDEHLTVVLLAPGQPSPRRFCRWPRFSRRCRRISCPHRQVQGLEFAHTSLVNTILFHGARCRRSYSITTMLSSSTDSQPIQIRDRPAQMCLSPNLSVSGTHGWKMPFFWAAVQKLHGLHVVNERRVFRLGETIDKADGRVVSN
jgi:hypothetical protein